MARVDDRQIFRHFPEPVAALLRKCPMAFLKCKFYVKGHAEKCPLDLTPIAADTFLHETCIFRNVITLLVHVCLSCSALFFKVPRARIIKLPVIIWEEYRLHAIVFTMRCACISTLAIAGFGQNRWALGLTVGAHHLMADAVTARYGTAGSSTVRVDDMGLRNRITRQSGGLNAAVSVLGMRAYSFYQFMAIASHITPNKRMADLGWNALIAIQSSAFLMTLCRKGRIRSETHALVYTVCLCISAFHIHDCFRSWPFIAGVLIAFWARAHLKWNKYVIWVAFSATHALVM